MRYIGSTDDVALNRGVARYPADPTGHITVPVLTMHAVDDPTAFVELESTYRETVERAGAAERLVQVFTGEHQHSYCRMRNTSQRWRRCCTG